MLEFILKFFLAASAIILLIIVMLQRGKGGGLAGALGGMGGQSAFGTKAGDLFTKITVGIASFWILISIFAAIYAPSLSGVQINLPQNAAAPSNPGREAPPAGKPSKSDAGKPAEKAGVPAPTPPAAPPAKTPTATAPPAKAPAK